MAFIFNKTGVNPKLMKQLDFHSIRTNPKERIDKIWNNRTPIALLCDNMAYIQNIGSIFRLADAARLQHVYFYNPQISLEAKKITKVARSTNKYVPFSILNIEADLKTLQEQYEWVALEKTDKSTPYTSFKKKTDKPLLLIAGSEVRGVSPFLLKQCSESVEIPMLGVNTSMNVASATAIVVYGLMS